jgi:hypothetical protein
MNKRRINILFSNSPLKKSWKMVSLILTWQHRQQSMLCSLKKKKSYVCLHVAIKRTSYDLKHLWWQYTMKCSQAINHANVEQVSNVLETVSASIIRGWCDVTSHSIFIHKVSCQLPQCTLHGAANSLLCVIHATYYLGILLLLTEFRKPDIKSVIENIFDTQQNELWLCISVKDNTRTIWEQTKMHLRDLFEQSGLPHLGNNFCSFSPAASISDNSVER